MRKNWIIACLMSLVASATFAAPLVVRGHIADRDFDWLGTDIDQLNEQCTRLYHGYYAISYANEVVFDVDYLSPVVIMNTERHWNTADGFCGDVITHVKMIKGMIPRVTMDECSSDWLRGEVRTVNINHGRHNRLCNNYGDIVVLQTLCDAGYQASNQRCIRRGGPIPIGSRCSNGSLYGEQRLEQIPYGHRYVYCDRGRLEIISVTCDMLYQIEGDHCIRIPGW